MSSFGGAFLGGLGGGTIGRAVVDLVLNSQQYNAQLSEAEAQTKTSTSGMAGGLSAFKGVAVASAAVAAAAIVDFAKTSVQAYIDLENAQLKLANSVENSNKVNAESIPIFEAQATAVSQLTGVHNDAIISVQGFLVQMGASASQVQALTPLVVDLSTKMGIGLDQAAKAVGKSINGSAGGLQRMAIVVDKTAFKTDHFGATLKALGAVSGFAAEQAKLEPWKLLGNQFHLLAQQTGEELVPALQHVIPVLVDIVKGLGYGVGAVADFADGIDNFGRVIPPANAVMTDMVAAIDASTQATHPARAAFNAHAAAVQELTRMFEQGQIDQTTYTDDLKTLNDETGRAVQGLVPESTALAAVATQHKNAAKAARDQRAAEQALTDSTFGYLDSLKTLRTDQQKVNQLKKEGKRGTQEFADAVLAEIEAQRSYSDAIKQLGTDMKKAGDSTQVIRDKVFDLGRQAGLSRPDIQALFDSITTGANKANDNLTGLGDGVDRLRARFAKPVTLDVRIAATTSGLTPGTDAFAAAVRAALLRAQAVGTG